MAGLRVFTSNRLEILADALADLVGIPLASPLDPEIIVVQSRGMERWVSMQLAERHGICANCRFPFPNVFIQDVFRTMLQDVQERSLFDPDVMTWRIMKALPLLMEEPAFETIRIYLEGGRSDLKRFQLSRNIADLFDQYLLFRPEMMSRWEKGKAVHWQSLLWRRLVQGHEGEHRAALAGEFFKAIEKSPDPPAGLPKRISVFGISALPRFHVHMFAALTRFSEVNLFLMNPCKEYWGEILASSEMKRKMGPRKTSPESDLHMEKGNSLLASMGGLGRDFFEMIQDFGPEEFSFYKEPTKQTLLGFIQQDILNLREREEKKSISLQDPSIQIHSCHSPMREVEVLRDQLLRMFEENPDLLPKDILVMTPDIETYAPYIQAVFDTRNEEDRRIPFSIADRSVRKEGGIGEAFLNILDLEGSRFGVTQILNILENEAVRRKFGFSEQDLERARQWISDTRIRWGIDGEHKKELGLPPFPQNTWRAGIERLLLGFAMPGREENLFSGILPYDAVEGGQTRILGALTEFAETLIERTASLGRLKTLAAWRKELSELPDDFFEPGEEAEREVLLIRRILDELSQAGKLAFFDEAAPLRIVRSCLDQRLDQAGFGYGFMTGGVTFCAMLPMRSIPFSVICLLGMDGDAYPRQSKSLGFDYMAKYPRRGDRSRRGDDRYLFLEALLSARERLYISYVGQSIQDNSSSPPSVLVSELMDYVEQGFEVPGKGIGEHLHTRHRLQAFSPEYFKGHPKLFTYTAQNHEIAQSIKAGRKDGTTFLSTGLSEPDEGWGKANLQGLCTFFSNPAKYLLNRRLGLYLEEGHAVAEEREPFEVQGLEQYLLEETMLRRRLQGRALKEHFRFAFASGGLPHGTVGQCVYERISPGVEQFARTLTSLMGEEGLEPVDFELDAGGLLLTGSVDHIFRDRMIRYRCASIKGRDLVAGWIHHLILNMVGPEGYPRQTLIAGLSGKPGKERKRVFYEYAPVKEAEPILEGLIERYREGLRRPLRFFPEASWTYGELRLGKEKSKEAALEQARKTWEGGGFNRGEQEDPYYRLCFREQDPIDNTFEEIAVEIFEPLLKHLKEQSG